MIRRERSEADRSLSISVREHEAMIDLGPYRSKIDDICKALAIKRLDLVGSAARDDFCPVGSDIDVLIEFEGHTDLFHRYFELKARLESLFGRKVDVIQAKAVKNPYVRETIERDRILVYGA